MLFPYLPIVWLTLASGKRLTVGNPLCNLSMGNPLTLGKLCGNPLVVVLALPVRKSCASGLTHWINITLGWAR